MTICNINTFYKETRLYVSLYLYMADFFKVLILIILQNSLRSIGTSQCVKLYEVGKRLLREDISE